MYFIIYVSLHATGALAYVELGKLITKSGAEFPYMTAAMGRVVAFLFAWTKNIILTPSSRVIICLTFAEYAMSLMDIFGEPQILKKMITSLAMSKKSEDRDYILQKPNNSVLNMFGLV